MTIEDLIGELAEFQRVHGNLQVMAYPQVKVSVGAAPEIGLDDDIALSTSPGGEVSVKIGRYPLYPGDVPVKPDADAIARAHICVISGSREE